MTVYRHTFFVSCVLSIRGRLFVSSRDNEGSVSSSSTKVRFGGIGSPPSDERQSSILREYKIPKEKVREGLDSGESA